jgi:RPA family protein
MARRREPALPVLAQELSRAHETHVEDREYSPTYLISEMGSKLSRVLIGGILTDVENRGSETDPFYMARMVDLHGDTYYLRAGQYNPEGAAALSKIETPTHVISVGRVRAYSPDDSDSVYVSVQPENVRAVSEQEVSVWAIKACESLMRRLKGDDAELSTREKEGLGLAQEKYDTVSTESYAGLLYDCLRNLSGDTTAPSTAQFTGEFETASDVEAAVTEPEVAPVAPEPPASIAEQDALTGDESPAAAPDGEPEGDADAEAAVLELIGSLDKEGDGEGVIYETLRDSAAAAGIDGSRLDEVIDSLNDQGLTYQPAFNKFRVA